VAAHDPIPLCIDLDGTLIRSDTLLESVLELLKAQPATALLLPLWLARGRAYLKARIAERISLAVDTLPYREEFVSWARSESATRPVVLVTAAHRRVAESIASHLGLFCEVMATGEVNLKAGRKAQALVERFGSKGFDYAGNDDADLPVWREARNAIVVGATPSVAADARASAPIAREFEPRPALRKRLVSWLRALRLYQWVKNVLVFVAPVAAHEILQPDTLISAFWAFIAFGLAASGVYLINDLFDLTSDRRHPRKRTRPFASGALPLASGLVAAPVLLLAALSIAAGLGLDFTLALLAYLVLTTIYSLWLKRKTFIDVALLAALYTLRVVAGAMATGLALSFWLVAVCAYGFLGLALLKRYSELREQELEGSIAVAGRGYVIGDLPVVLALGVGSSLVATLVTALYIESYASQVLYAHPGVLWALVGLMLLGMGRIWLIAGRGAMHDDPIVFVARDRWSLALVAIGALVVAFAM
jgi:4-hydroxybenzoate polyprenyltransferase/phosphoserine phosphatase